MFLTAFCLLAAVQQSPTTIDAGKAQWIWAPGYETGKVPEMSVYFRHTFEVDAPEKGTAFITCDNQYVLYVNGRRIAADGDWTAGEVHDISEALGKGRNTIAVKAWNEGLGYAGLMAAIVIRQEDKKSKTLYTDTGWKTSSDETRGWEKPEFEDSEWKAAVSFGNYGIKPWNLGPTGGEKNLEITLPGRQRVQPANDLKLLPGFKAELIYTVPKWAEGSWISMANDPKGRLIVSDQRGPLYRVTPGHGDVETEVERLKTPLGKAHGLLYTYDSLYVVGAGNSGTGLYRLRDTTGDDQFDEAKLLKNFAVGGEHDGHAVVRGPDDFLYIICGNHTNPPKGIRDPSPFRNYADDWLLPQLGPPSGHAQGRRPPGGYVLKTDKDGTTWEMICGGFRNPYDIAFNADGELFAYDADMEYDSGTPWFRPTRLNHVISGAEFGWRRGAAKWPAYYADSFGSVIDIGQGSPTGITFGYGAKFPTRYRAALYLNDWTYGRIRVVHLEPRGATYVATAEDFVVGRPLPLTDVVIGRDGAMYFIVGGRNTQSKMFRVTYDGEAGEAAPVRASAARTTRRRLEAFHAKRDPKAVDAAWPYLDSPDRALRHAARIAIEHQDPKTWRDRALAERRPQATIMAVIALARAEDKEAGDGAIASLERLALEKLPAEQAVEALRAYALVFIRLGPPIKATAARLAAKFESMFPADDTALNHELARLLVYLESEAVVKKTVALMGKSRIQEDQMFYANLLRLAKKGWTIDDRKACFNWINRARFRLRGGDRYDAGGYFHYEGGRSFRPYVKKIREETLATLSDSEKNDAGLKAVVDAEAPPAPGSAFVIELKRQPSSWQMSDLIPALERAGRGRSFAVGRAAYEALGCAKCHRFGAFEGDLNLGPDLTTAGNRYSARDLLENIIEPSKVISDQIAARYFLTREGITYTGSIVTEDAKEVVIRPDPGKKATVSILKDQIVERGRSKISRMPMGLIDYLTEEQILDLLAYVLYGADPKHEAFSREEEGAWVSLFDGKTLKGWKQLGGKAKFEVVNGTILGTTVPKTGNSFLCTEKEYGNFILELEFKIDGRLNSGIQIRSHSREDYRNGRVHGYQVEIDPDPKRARWWTAGIYDESRGGWLDPARGDTKREKFFTETGAKIFKQGAWNKIRVEARGDHIRAWLNGVARGDLKEAKTESGFIGLQVHSASTGGMKVQWRNVRIRELE